MLYKLSSFAILVITLSLIGCASGRYAQNTKNHALQRDTLQRMSQQDVINLSKAGVSDSLIIGMMDATDTWFQLKPQDVIDLKHAGVSEKVLSAMMQQPVEPPDQSSSPDVRYYPAPPYYWYGGLYPYWYSPSFSVRLGFRSHHPPVFHHRRFR